MSTAQHAPRARPPACALTKPRTPPSDRRQSVAWLTTHLQDVGVEGDAGFGGAGSHLLKPVPQRACGTRGSGAAGRRTSAAGRAAPLPRLEAVPACPVACCVRATHRPTQPPTCLDELVRLVLRLGLHHDLVPTAWQQGGRVVGHGGGRCGQ